MITTKPIRPTRDSIPPSVTNVDLIAALQPTSL